ncbi:unnamed protein product (macronuclear) [Paramecium tetraurelia]|uniref:Ubiquitin-like domain-containing protein n=1 Tax=Paramecium tetraurelia TaxID=5888 RepID=A0E2Q5_PARTE|nr:uncharacterized protein GSPATT00022744001 [Paramecium tetraurelia]CAK89572.1 unnamed protein product [Paramecium tetraurelia]|eukprot:XP_001456969.1 hypothetical protein (macronuclear) [Paramecium tetraurelia strain d4-2]
MIEYQDQCEEHPQFPISMVCLNPKIFPQRKICCQCLISFDKKNQLKENELISIQEFYKRLEQLVIKINDAQKVEQAIFESLNKMLKECKAILDQQNLNLIQLEIKKLISGGIRPLSYSELKFYSNVLVHDFQQKQQIIEELKKSLDSASNNIQNAFLTYQKNNSIKIQVNIKRYDQGQINVTLPIHQKIQDLKLEFGQKDDQISLNCEEIKNTNTTLFENNIWSGDTISIQKQIRVTLIDKQYQTLNFLLLASDNILKIKKLVQQKEGIDPSQQKIIYYGRVLQDFEKLNDFKSSLGLDFLLDINKTTINLFNLDEKPQCIKLNPNFTFENIIHQIQYHFDIPYNLISSLLINNKPLLNNQQIKNLVDIQTETINLEIKLSRPVILAKTLSGKIIIVNPQENNTILHIKQQIENKYNILISHQHIYHKMSLLDNLKTLQEIGIKQLDILNIKCDLDIEFRQEFIILIQRFPSDSGNCQLKIKPQLSIINQISEQDINLEAQLSSIFYYVKGFRIKQGQCCSDFNLKENDLINTGCKFRACSKWE